MYMTAGPIGSSPGTGLSPRVLPLALRMNQKRFAERVSLRESIAIDAGIALANISSTRLLPSFFSKRKGLPMSKQSTVFIGILALLFCPLCALADDIYFYAPVQSLELSGDELPLGTAASARPGSAYQLPDARNFRFYQPYAVGEQSAEIYVEVDPGFTWNPRRSFIENLDGCRIAIRSKKTGKPLGKLFLPKPDCSGFFVLDFVGPDPSVDQAGMRDKFFKTKENHYTNLLTWQAPGAAWFRHQARAARQVRTGDPRMTEPRTGRRQNSDLQDTFSLFTGGRAVSENIQLDRELRVEAGSGNLTVPIDSIVGITTSEIDWSDLIDKSAPEKDALSRAIPFDQHALFFPRFRAMADCVDEARERGTPVLRLIDSRSEDALTLERYERQLCLPLDFLARAIGPRLIASAAMTGSDPCLRAGSDVAILFEAIDATALRAMIAARHSAALSNATRVETVTGKIVDDIPYTGVVSPGREICSYAATIDKVVVVTNSLVQLERIACTLTGDLQSIAQLDEYTFFRDRYRRGDPAESAFLIVSDATIRRWCSPRWRIAISRRTRAAAALSEMQAKHLGEIRGGIISARQLEHSQPVPAFGDLFIDGSGVRSTGYGSLGFLTPIVELPIDRVSEEEKNAYEWYRTRYQRNWRQYFDPIAARLSLDPDKVELDLTVMPLIASSEYRPFMESIGNRELKPDAGDRHPEAGLHFIMALDSDSQPVKQASGFVSAMLVGVEANPLNWIGDWLTVYAEEDPFWDELAAAGKEKGPRGLEKFFEENFSRLPVVLHLDVANGFKLVAFLTAIHAFVEQSSPGMTHWEPLKHNGEDYVKISPTRKGRRAMSGVGDFDDLAVFYAATGESLVVTLNERALKASLDRLIARLAKKEAEKDPPGAPWLGRSMAIEANRSALDVIETIFDGELRSAMKNRSWSNLAILNEWRRLLQEKDPVGFHQNLWKTKLVCPGGGAYRWNDEFRTMESTIYGHPGAPRPGADQPSPLDGIKNAGLGISFENDGLRARARLDRSVR